MLNQKYPALNTIINVYRILGWITIGLTVVLMIVGIVSTFISGQYIGAGFFGFLGAVLGAVLGSIVLVFIYGAVGLTAAVLQFAIAEVLQVFVDIEANTRA